jgi:hypothetical protein
MMLNQKEIYAAIISGTREKRAMYTTDFTETFGSGKSSERKLTSSLKVLMDGGAPSPKLCKTCQ